VEVSYPFGFGLSYTTFAFSNISVAPVDYPGERRRLVSVDVKNTGTRAGAEVVQLYVHPVAPPVARPTKELKGFKKVTLAPGESKRVEILLDERSFSYYDPAKKGWFVAPGDYEIQVGNSSRNVLLRTTVVMNAH
jgi:beta-glucosidase